MGNSVGSGTFSRKMFRYWKYYVFFVAFAPGYHTLLFGIRMSAMTTYYSNTVL